MAAVWAAFGIASAFLFEDVPRTAPAVQSIIEPEDAIPMEPISISPSKEDVTETRRSVEEGRDIPELSSPASLPDHVYRPSAGQWGVVATMCWFSMTCCEP